MKKTSGYTLAELLITLGIVGIIAAIMGVVLTNLKPDPLKTQYLKRYDALTAAVHSIAGNSKIYPVMYKDTNDEWQDVKESPLYNTNEGKGRYAVYGDGDLKLCKALNDYFNGNTSGTVCSSNTDYPGDNKTMTPSFSTKNGTDWLVYVNRVEEDATAGKSASFEGKIYIDVNKEDAPNCTYSDSCQTPDRFLFLISPNGSVLPGDDMGAAYIKTRTSLFKKKEVEIETVDASLPSNKKNIKIKPVQSGEPAVLNQDTNLLGENKKPADKIKKIIETIEIIVSGGNNNGGGDNNGGGAGNTTTTQPENATTTQPENTTTTQPENATTTQPENTTTTEPEHNTTTQPTQTQVASGSGSSYSHKKDITYEIKCGDTFKNGKIINCLKSELANPQIYYSSIYSDKTKKYDYSTFATLFSGNQQVKGIFPDNKNDIYTINKHTLAYPATEDLYVVTYLPNIEYVVYKKGNDGLYTRQNSNLLINTADMRPNWISQKYFHKMCIIKKGETSCTDNLFYYSYSLYTKYKDGADYQKIVYKPDVYKNDKSHLGIYLLYPTTADYTIGSTLKNLALFSNSMYSNNNTSVGSAYVKDNGSYYTGIINYNNVNNPQYFIINKNNELYSAAVLQDNISAEDFDTWWLNRDYNKKQYNVHRQKESAISYYKSQYKNCKITYNGGSITIEY